MVQHYTSREIFNILEEEIISLKIKPGSILSENNLCERFGVSRSPIRSVLQELRLSGLITITPYKATQVTLMNFGIINQIIYQRIAVETFVLEDFIRTYDLLTLEKIRHLHLCMVTILEDDKFDTAKFYALDSRLHGTWFHAVGKGYLWECIQQSNCHYTRFRMLDIVEARNFQQIVKEHAELLDIMENRDVDSIRPLIQKHLSGGITRLGQLIFTDLKAYFTETP